MSEVIDIDGNALLEKYGTGQQTRKQRLRKNVQLLFLGLSAEETAPLITLLRTSRISPRGKQVNTEQEFLDALGERSWDLILCTIDRGDFTSKLAISHLKRLDKDIPVIQIIPSSDSQLLLQGLKNHIQAVVPLDEKELVLINVRRELDQLDYRRRLRKAEAALAEAEKRSQQLMDSSRHPIICCDHQKIVYCNDSFLEQFGLDSKKKAIHKSLIDFFVPDDRAELAEQLNSLEETNAGDLLLQFVAQRSDHSEFTANMELSRSNYNDSVITRVLLHIDESSNHHLLSKDLDFVSGLFNKDYLDRQLEQTTQKALRGGNDQCLIYIELDQIEAIKNKFSHEGSDQLIRDISSLLGKKVNKAHLLTHPADNAFAIIFNDPNIKTAENFAEQLRTKIANVHSSVSGVDVQSTCSIALVAITDSTPPPIELLNRAKAAIYALRKDTPHGNGVRVHIPEAALSQQAEDEFDQLRKAVENNQFKLLFQPIVNLTAEDQTHHHYEALLRLVNDEEDELSPNDFMSAISDPETAFKVDRWVIEKSIKQLKKTLNQEHKNVIFINLSAHTLGNQKLLTWLSNTLRKNNIPAERLVFQISESDISIAPKQAHSFVEKLASIHSRICIKHFGSVTNSQNILSTIHSDFIKLDGAYIPELGSDPEQDEEFYSMVQQLNSLGKTSIAPLVENTKTMANLWKAGIDYVQGYYLQPPRENMDYDFFAE
ncbi:EAL domain-containing protein [Neptuniibacter sp. QD37_6]|uniref:sensor domain-containing phosphodiesterase n=1 Tax=Neptuniibacter sp. QD37_6 TaxID=3398210 RepID=UPI0039F58B08